MQSSVRNYSHKEPNGREGRQIISSFSLVTVVRSLIVRELNSGFLHFAVRQQPDKRFVVKIDNLDTVAPWITEIAAERRFEFQLVFAGEFLPYLCELLFVAHHDPEVAHVRGLNFFHLENGEELVLAELEKGVALAAVQFFEIENVFVKRDRLFDIVHLDRDMITSVNLHVHFPTYLASRNFVGRFCETPRYKIGV